MRGPRFAVSARATSGNRPKSTLWTTSPGGVCGRSGGSYGSEGWNRHCFSCTRDPGNSSESRVSHPQSREDEPTRRMSAVRTGNDRAVLAWYLPRTDRGFWGIQRQGDRYPNKKSTRGADFVAPQPQVRYATKLGLSNLQNDQRRMNGDIGSAGIISARATGCGGASASIGNRAHADFTQLSRAESRRDCRAEWSSRRRPRPTAPTDVRR